MDYNQGPLTLSGLGLNPLNPKDQLKLLDPREQLKLLDPHNALKLLDPTNALKMLNPAQALKILDPLGITTKLFGGIFGKSKPITEPVGFKRFGLWNYKTNRTQIEQVKQRNGIKYWEVIGTTAGHNKSGLSGLGRAATINPLFRFAQQVAARKAGLPQSAAPYVNLSHGGPTVTAPNGQQLALATTPTSALATAIQQTQVSPTASYSSSPVSSGSSGSSSSGSGAWNFLQNWANTPTATSDGGGMLTSAASNSLTAPNAGTGPGAQAAGGPPVAALALAALGLLVIMRKKGKR